MNWLIALIRLTFGNANNRLLAINYLAAHGGPGSWEQLTTKAVWDEDERVRQAALDAVRSRFGKKAIDLLIAELADRKELVRMKGTDLLVQMGEEAVSPLINALRSDDSKTRELSSEALGRIGGLQVVSVLSTLINDEKRAAVTDGVIASLTTILEEDENKSIRMKAADLLVQIGQAAIPPLINVLIISETIMDPGLPAQTLGRIGGLEVVSCLIPLMNDKREPVREATVEALSLIAGRLKSENAMERLSAVKALDVIGGSQAVESLVQTLEDEDPAVSWEAALVLEKNPNRNAIMTQVLALEQTKGNIPGVAYLLAHYGGSEVIDRLQKHVFSMVRHLMSQNPIQRLAAVKALDVIGGTQAIGLIMERLNDTDDRVSYAIAKALARRGDSATIQAKLSEWETSDKGKKYKDNEAVNTLVAASAALNSAELKQYTEGKSEETHKNIRAQLETQLNKLLDRYSPDTFGG